MNERRKEIAIAAGLMIFGFVTLFYLIPTQVEVAEEFELKSLSPAFFPELAAWLLVLLSAMLLAFSIAGTKKKAAADTETTCQPENEFTGADELRVWIAFLISVAYFYALQLIGFIPATILSLAGLFLLQGVRNPRKLTTLSVTTTILVYLFFHYVMKVYFPEALWFR